MKHNIPSASGHLQFLVQVQYAINNINPVQFVEYSSESKYKKLILFSYPSYCLVTVFPMSANLWSSKIKKE